jgi:hypothetical protein
MKPGYEFEFLGNEQIQKLSNLSWHLTLTVSGLLGKNE